MSGETGRKRGNKTAGKGRENALQAAVFGNFVWSFFEKLIRFFHVVKGHFSCPKSGAGIGEMKTVKNLC